MNFYDIYKAGINKYQLEEILLYLENHPSDFEKIFNLIQDENDKISFRALWTVEKVAQRNPSWFTTAQTNEIYQLLLTTTHKGMHRLFISIAYFLPVPQPLNVEILNALYDWMLFPKYTIGVQSLSMKLIHKWVKNEEDLLKEFLIVLTETDDSDLSPAFFASRKNILKHYK